MLKKSCKRDSCDVYGEHVAMKLRNYNERTRSIVQHLTNNILFEADMGKFNDVSTLNHFPSIRSNTFLDNRNSSISPVPVSSNCSNTNSQFSPRACTPNTRPETPCLNEIPLQFSASQTLIQKISPNETCSQSSNINSCVNNVEHCINPNNSEISVSSECQTSTFIPNNILPSTNTDGPHLIIL